MAADPGTNALDITEYDVPPLCAYVELKNSRTLQLFRSLPIEIITQVLLCLDPPDILSLRRTHSYFHKLVHSMESEISRVLTNRLCEPWDLKIFVRGCDYTLTSLFTLQFKLQVVETIARTISTHVVSKIKLLGPLMHHPQTSNEWKSLKTELLAKKLVPSLLLLYDFFERLIDVFGKGTKDLECFLEDAQPELKDIFDLEQQQIIEDLSIRSWDVHNTYILFRAVLLGLGAAYKTPSYQHFEEVNAILTYFGLAPFRKILHVQGDTVESPRSAVLRYHYQVWRNFHAQVPPKKSDLPGIYHLLCRTPKRYTLPPNRTRSTQLVFLNGQDIWQQAWHWRAGHLRIQRLGSDCTEAINKWMMDLISEPDDPGWMFGAYD